MKISRRTVWQMTPQGYELLEEDAFDHDGPVAAAKGGSKGVSDPTQQIAAEQNANQYNVVSPNGSIQYSKDPTGRTTQTTTLSPSEQKQLDTSNQIAETMLTGAQKKIPGLADTSFDYNDQGSTAAKAAYQRQVDLLDPEFKKQDTAWEDRLANQGIPLGSEAYLDSQRQHENDKNFALTQAAQQSETEGTQLALSQRQQQYNELAAALGGQQLNPVGQYGAAAAPVDAAGAYAQKNQAQIAQQLANTQSQNALLGAGAQLGGAYLGSRAPSRPSGAGGQAATSGATQTYTAPSNFESYSSGAPNVTDTAGGTTTYFGEPSDGLDYVTPSVSKIGTGASAPSTGWLGTIGKGASAANDAYNLYGGLNEGGVKGYGGALAAGSSLAGLAGAGGAGATTLGAIGNAAAGNYVGAAKDVYDLYKGYTAASGAATGSAAAGGASAGSGVAAGASSALTTALPLFLAYNLGQGLVNSSSDPKAAANRNAYSDRTNVNASLQGFLGTNGTPKLAGVSGTGDATTYSLADGTKLDPAQWSQLMGLYQGYNNPYAKTQTSAAQINDYLASLPKSAVDTSTMPQWKKDYLGIKG